MKNYSLVLLHDDFAEWPSARHVAALVIHLDDAGFTMRSIDSTPLRTVIAFYPDRADAAATPQAVRQAVADAGGRQENALIFEGAPM